MLLLILLAPLSPKKGHDFCRRRTPHKVANAGVPIANTVGTPSEIFFPQKHRKIRLVTMPPCLTIGRVIVQYGNFYPYHRQKISNLSEAVQKCS